MPNFEAVEPHQESYGLRRLDHAVGNVHVMADTVSYLQRATGFHQFAEFTTEDVGTVDSGVALGRQNGCCNMFAAFTVAIQAIHLATG